MSVDKVKNKEEELVELLFVALGSCWFFGGAHSFFF
jgi:hypothetical protein